MYGKGSSELTAIETAVSRTGRFDLAAGYPNLLLPNWARRAVREANEFSQHLLQSRGLPDGSLSEALTRATVTAALEFLHLPLTHLDHTFVTSTGSLALERGITAIGAGREALIVEPEIDLIPALTRESFGVEPRVFDGVDKAIQYLRDRCSAEAAPYLVMSNPNNPTGKVLSSGDVESLSQLCAAGHVHLLIDSCFASVTSTKNHGPLAPSWLPATGAWIALWDTGKTFGICHEKLAFMICSPSLSSSVRSKLQILQFDIPPRTLRLFANLLSAARDKDYKSWIWAKISKNSRVLKEQVGEWFDVKEPDATGFACMYPTSRLSHFSTRQLTEVLLQKTGVGLVDGALFYSSGIERADSTFLRCALAREPGVFQRAIRELRAGLSQI